MKAIDEQLTMLLHELAAAARPAPDLPAVLEGTRRVRIVTGQAQVTRRPHRTLGIAAAVILAGGAGLAVVDWHRGSEVSPASDPPHITYPDQVPAARRTAPASAPTFSAVMASPEGAGLAVRGNAEPLEGAPQPPLTGPIGGQTVTDLDNTTPAAIYVATCCAPSGTIWRNGADHETATRIDYVLDGVLKATVDPATSTARVGGVVLHEPGVLDVSVLDRHSVVMLVDEPAPRLIVISTDDFTAAGDLHRRTIALPTGTSKPCGIVALQQGVLVLAGKPVGVDACVSDRGFIVDPQTGVVTTAIRLPAPVRGINSDHVTHVIAVTVDGDVMIGEFASPATDPVWSTVLEGDYLAAGLW